MSNEEQAKPNVEEKPAEDKPAEDKPAEEKPAADNTAVYVTNLAPEVTSKTLADFFGFCGAIKTLVLRADESKTDGTQEAAIAFETASAASTALILTNAIIVDRAIVIVPYTAGLGLLEEKKGEVVDGADIEQKDFSVPDEERSKTSVVASLMASGYKLGNDVKQRAIEIDQRLKIRETFTNAVHTVQQKIEEQHVKENLQQFGTTVSTSLETAGAAIAAGANSLGEAAMRNQYISSAWGALSAWGGSVAKGFRNITGMNGDDSGDAADVPEGEEKKTEATNEAPGEKVMEVPAAAEEKKEGEEKKEEEKKEEEKKETTAEAKEEAASK